MCSPEVGLRLSGNGNNLNLILTKELALSGKPCRHCFLGGREDLFAQQLTCAAVIDEEKM